MLQLERHKLHYHVDRLAAWSRGEKIVPVTLEISPSSVCNHRCLMCGYEYLGHQLGVMDESLLLRVAAEVVQAGVRGVVFAGDGEPFCNRSLPRAIDLLHYAGVDVALSTNGALLSDARIPQLADQLTWIRFSVNGTTAESYGRVHRCAPENYEQVLRKIERLVKEKQRRQGAVTVGVQLVLLPENIHGVEEFAKRIKGIGADYLVFKPFYFNGNNQYGGDFSLDYRAHAEALTAAEALSSTTFHCRMRWETLSNSARTYRQCLGWPFFYYLRTDGEVFPCLARQHEDVLSLGNLNDVSFDEICRGDRCNSVSETIAGIDVATCQPNCRHHSMNTFLWDIRHPDPHKDFV